MLSSLASIFIGRWDVAVKGKAPETLQDQLGIAVTGQTYKPYRSFARFAAPATHPVYTREHFENMRKFAT